MKVMLCTTPIRPEPNNFPPIGSLSIINHLRKNGQEVDFFNIDALRPSYEAVLDRIVAASPDVLGISAVVSTAYAYVKRLVMDVKRLRPETLIVVGGSLAASAEILLRRVGIDLCVTGEGEKIFLEICQRAETSRRPSDFADIPGLVFLGDDGGLVNTGYETPLSAPEIYDIDWSDLERSADMGIFVQSIFDENGDVRFSWFQRDPRTYQPHRRDRNVVVLVASKGCVARCTFCHRWEKGIRYIPVEVLEQRIEELIRRYNIGFISFGDENFGTDRRWLERFCAMIKRFDLLWAVAGMRVNCVSPDRLAMMKDAGCASVMFGMESGSDRILQVMEKKVTAQHNRDAITWITDAGLNTVVQLVLGMPGESPETVRETAEFAKFALTRQPWQSPFDLSINYAQALPGTPLYEYARRKGLVGDDMDSEEAYLLRVSDRDAADAGVTLNFTDQPADLCQMWRPYVMFEVRKKYAETFGYEHYHRRVIEDSGRFEKKRKVSGYFADPMRAMEKGLVSDSLSEMKNRFDKSCEYNIPPLQELGGRIDLLQICYPVEFEKLLRLNNMADFNQMMDAKTVPGGPFDYKSLRRIVWQDQPPLPGDAPAALPLRQGR